MNEVGIIRITGQLVEVMGDPPRAHLNHKLAPSWNQSGSEEQSQTWADGALLSGHKAFTQIGSPPYIERLGAAAGVAVESQPLWCPFLPTAALGLNKVDPGGQVLASGDRWPPPVWLCHVCDVRVAGQQNPETCVIHNQATVTTDHLLSTI